MGVALLGILALVGLGLAAAGKAKAKAPPTPAAPKKPVSKVKIKKKKPTRPPKPKEVEAAKKIKKAKIKGDTVEDKKVLKKLTEIVVKDDPNVHPIVKEEAKKKLKETAKPKADLSALAKLYRAQATKGFPWVYTNLKTKALIWANKKGADAANTNKNVKFIKFDPKLATNKQKKQWSQALAALAPKKAAPSPIAQPTANLAELAKYFRTTATYEFPYVYRNKSNQALIWANKPGADALVAKGTHVFVQFNPTLATNAQNQEWQYSLKALAPDGPAPLPPAAKREIVKTVVKAETTPPTPQQAAKALQIYTKEGGWQGDKSKPSQVVYDCQKHMGDKGADGIIGQGTRDMARKLGYPLYARSYTAPGAYNKAEPLTRR